MGKTENELVSISGQSVSIMFRTANMYSKKSVNISCSSMQFQALSFCGTHAKTHGLIGLSKHYYLQLGPKLCHGKCAIIKIPCSGIACKNMLDKTWVIVSDPNSQPYNQPIEYCTYWPVLVSFDKWNIIQSTNKTTTNEDFYAVHKVVLYGIVVTITYLSCWNH